MNIFKSAGVTVGIIVGLIITVIILKIVNTDHKSKTEYDERQKAVRGRGYMYAFYAIVGFELIMSLLEMSGITLPVENASIHFAGILIGAIVLCCYCIWNDGYWGLNNNPRKYYVIFILTAVLNVIPIVGAVREGRLMEDGKLTTPFLNIMVLIMIAIVGGVFIAKSISDNHSADN